MAVLINLAIIYRIRFADEITREKERNLTLREGLQC